MTSYVHESQEYCDVMESLAFAHINHFIAGDSRLIDERILVYYVIFFKLMKFGTNFWDRLPRNTENICGNAICKIKESLAICLYQTNFSTAQIGKETVQNTLSANLLIPFFLITRPYAFLFI